MSKPREGSVCRWMLALASLAGVLGAPALAAGQDASAKPAESGAMRPVLLPAPQIMRPSDSVFLPAPDRMICFEQGDRDAMRQAGKIVQEALHTLGVDWPLTAGNGIPADRIGVTLAIDPAAVRREEGYQLDIEAGRIGLAAHDGAGLYYGATTLRQLARDALDRSDSPRLQTMHIEDWPDFKRRGFMLDISRDRIPTQETLYKLVDLMSELKLNEFQLYMETAFAYPGHEAAWADYTPMTAEEIIALDAYCRERHVDLVPNQNTLAHMERWLRHSEYRHLSEQDDRRWTTLAPAQPGSIQLVSNLLDELLPNFTSAYANVGCDEADEVGQGKSKALVERMGYEQVYLDHLQKVHEIVTRHGKTMQFWGDIVVKHPDMARKIPKDAIPMVWYYEDEHRDYFDTACAVMQKARLPFYVCPGTGTWVSLLGRTKNCIANLRDAAQYGKQYGARGYLICNWGNFGFFEHLPISYLPMAYGAALSWAGEANGEMDLPAALDVQVFGDRAHVMGRLAYDLGNAYQETEVYVQDTTPLGCLPYFAAVAPEWDKLWYRDGALTVEGCQRVIDYVDKTMARLPDARMGTADGDEVAREFQNDADLLRHSARLAQALLATESRQIKDIPAPVREALAADLAPIIPRFIEIWMLRHRAGGLEKSLDALYGLMKGYRS